MTYWSETLERLVQDSLSGKLKEADHDLVGLMQPFDIADHERLVKDWRKVRQYGEMADGYLLEQRYLVGESLNGTIKKALREADGIDRKVRSKRSFVRSQLVQAVERAQKKTLACKTAGAVNKQAEVLDYLADLGERLDQSSVANTAREARILCEERTRRLVREKNASERSRSEYSLLVDKANEYLRKGSRRGRLRKMRTRLSDFRAAHDLSDDQREELSGLVESYDGVIGRKQQESLHNAGRRFKRALHLSLLAVSLYVGYVGAPLLTGGVRDIVQAYEERRAQRAQEVADDEAAQSSLVDRAGMTGKGFLGADEIMYDSMLRIEDLSFVASAFREDDLSTITAEQYERIKRSVIYHLRPVLADAPLTLYVEKSTNTSYLIKQQEGEYWCHGPLTHTDGIDPSRKVREGQHSTPEGVYRIVRFTDFDGESVIPYGLGAYLIDYPNAEDRRAGATGGGVVLCSSANGIVEQAIREGRDVMHSGVAYDDASFIELRERVFSEGAWRHAQVVIEDYSRRPLEGLR